MANTPLQFATTNKAWTDSFIKNSDKIIKEATIKLAQNIVDDSPIKSGAFVNAWEINNPDQIFDPVETSSKQEVKQEIETKIESLKPGTEIEISNNAPYATRLEFGWSDQSPLGFFRNNIAQFGTILNKVAGKYFK